MRTLLLSTTLAALVATSALALAASHQASGMIKAFDMKAHTLTLQDGASYALRTNFKDPGLKVGEKVSITWEKSGNQMLADTVTIVK